MEAERLKPVEIKGLKPPGPTIPVAPVVDTTSVEEPFIPDWDGDKQDQTGTVSTWSSGPNSEWAAAAAKDQDTKRTIGTDERSMVSDGLYSLTIGQGAITPGGWRAKNKVHQTPIAELRTADPLSTMIHREQGFKLLA